MEKIELNQLPQELRRAVEGALAHDKGSKLLGCTKYESNYRAYTEQGSLLAVWSTHCGNSMLKGKVFEETMTIGDVQFFLENCDQFKR